MSRKYIEIIEELPKEVGVWEVPMIIRIEVADEAEAVQKAKDNKDKIPGSKQYIYVESNHFKDPKLNKPCKAKQLDKTLIEN